MHESLAECPDQALSDFIFFEIDGTRRRVIRCDGTSHKARVTCPCHPYADAQSFQDTLVISASVHWRWHRAAEFQRVSLKLIAEGLLLGGANTGAKQLTLRRESTASKAKQLSLQRESTASKDLAQGLYFSGELTCAKLSFKQPVTLGVSLQNPGAEDVAKELAESFSGINIRLIGGDRAERDYTSLEWLTASETCFFLVYLNMHTFRNAAGERLADQIRTVLKRHPKGILLLHENDETKCGCDFDRWRRACCHSERRDVYW